MIDYSNFNLLFKGGVDNGKPWFPLFIGFPQVLFSA